MSTVFLSYARADLSRVGQLVQPIKKHGRLVWRSTPPERNVQEVSPRVSPGFSLLVVSFALNCQVLSATGFFAARPECFRRSSVA
jgi:hypothetical protein